MPRVRGRGRRATFARPEKKHEESEEQYDMQSGRPENIHKSPHGAGNVQGETEMSSRSPAKESKEYEDLQPDSGEGGKDSESNEDPIPESQVNSILSDSKPCKDVLPDGSQKFQNSSMLTQADLSQTSPSRKKSAAPRRDYKKDIRNDPQIEKDLVEFYKRNLCLWDLRQEDHNNRNIKKIPFN